MNLLVIFDEDYADEFDVYGFRIMSKDKWDEFVEATKKINYPIEIYFGTNEAIEYESSKEVLRSFKLSELSNMDAACIKSHFKHDFGWDPIDYILDTAGNQEKE